MSPKIPTLLLGCANIGPDVPSTLYTYNTRAKVDVILDSWYALGGRRLDTARYYGLSDEQGLGGSERGLREVGDSLKRFEVDTTIYGFAGGSHADGKIRESLEHSLADLGVSSVNTLYLHWPDRETPFLSVLRDLDELHKEGKCETIGISNFSADEVDQMCNLATEHNLISPTVYQGQYSALCRGGDTQLFPTLRKHGIAFRAYSPLAMGMLSGGEQKESVEAARTLPPGSRFHPDSRKSSVFQREWFKPKIFDAIKSLNRISAETGISPTELSLRWIANHSALKAELGDGIILGASSTKQLEETVAALEAGPLSDDAASAMSNLWEICKDVAPRYC